MTNNNEVLVMEPGEQQLTALPSDILDDAIKASQALTSVINQKQRPVIINEEQYLEYEDWQTLGQFYGYGASTGEAQLVEIAGVLGAKATAKLVNLRTGEMIGGAEAYCMRDEDRWETRPWFQLASMAQTRAGAKALRNRLAWVAVLGGYRPTPAEEMQNETPLVKAAQQLAGGDNTEHYCKEHGTFFFKKGKMKSYAHPIEDTGKWCSEHTSNQPPKVKTEPAHNSEPDFEQAEKDKELWDGEPPAQVGDEDIRTLQTTIKNAGWDNFRLGKYLKEKGVEVKQMRDLNPLQIATAVRDIQAEAS